MHLKRQLTCHIPIWQTSTQKHLRMATLENRLKEEHCMKTYRNPYSLLSDSEHNIAVAAVPSVSECTITLLALHAESDYTIHSRKEN